MLVTLESIPEDSMDEDPSTACTALASAGCNPDLVEVDLTSAQG